MYDCWLHIWALFVAFSFKRKLENKTKPKENFLMRNHGLTVFLAVTVYKQAKPPNIYLLYTILCAACKVVRKLQFSCTYTALCCCSLSDTTRRFVAVAIMPLTSIGKIKSHNIKAKCMCLEFAWAVPIFCRISGVTLIDVFMWIPIYSRWSSWTWRRPLHSNESQNYKICLKELIFTTGKTFHDEHD